MTLLQAANWIFAAVVFGSVACRLANLNRCKGGKSDRAGWYAWVLAHCLIALGAFAIMLGPLYGYTTPVLPEVGINAGLALYFGLRWRPRCTP